MTVKGEYLADLFGGSGIVSRQCRMLGVQSREWSGQCAAGDLLKGGVQRRLREDIMKGKVVAACLAPPCGTFSVAVSRSCRLRSKEEPWGLAGLEDRLEEKVKHGNDLLRTAIRIMKWLLGRGTPFCFEHPVSAYSWATPELEELLQSPVCV